jgi:hypothetical protein
MSTLASHARWHRIFAVAAIVHATIILAALFAVHQQGTWLWLPRLWVGLTTLWFFWPIILALHAGSSRRRAYLSLGLSALLLVWPIRSYLELFAPSVLAPGFGPGYLDPYAIGRYCAGYISGWVDSKQRSGADIIMLEGYGMGGDETPGVPALSAVAAKRYRLRVQSIALCGVTPYILGHAAGYNAVSAEVMKRRYGADIMDVLAREWKLEQERYEVAAEVGRADAQRDVAAGQLTLEVLPHKANSSAEPDMRALTRYGVALRQVGSENEMVGLGILRRASAYNELVESEIERRFGAEVAQAVVAAAKRGNLYPGGSN